MDFLGESSSKNTLNEASIDYSDLFWNIYDHFGGNWDNYRECKKFFEKNDNIIFYKENGGKEPSDVFYRDFIVKYWAKETNNNLSRWMSNYKMYRNEFNDIMKFLEDNRLLSRLFLELQM